MVDKDICILVVDDFSTMRRLIKRILKELELTNIIEADNGVAAWERINEQQVDLVVCDWNMPTMTGLDLLEKLRADERFTQLPFIMVTAEGKKESVIEATKKGVTGYITKPFNAKDLERKLKTVFNE